MAIDVTDATFQTEVIERSATTAVVLDLWAPWCGPCKTLGPILEKVVGETGGKAVLVKVDIDENPGIAQAFRVQSIPMVVGFKDGQPVDAFMGAQGEHEVREFVQRLLPTQEENTLASLVQAGDEASLRLALICSSTPVSPRRRWPCSHASPNPSAPGWSLQRHASVGRPTTITTRRSPHCSTGSRPTTRPASSSSTSSN